MNELSVGFSALSDRPFCDLSKSVHNALTHEPGLSYFPLTSPTVSDLLTGIIANDDALNGDGTPTNVALRRSTREALVLMMQRLAADLELKANGDLVKLAATGFSFKKTPVKSQGPLAAPQNLRVKTTGTAGEAMAKVAAVALASGYEAQFTLDPMSGEWTPINLVTDSQKILFTGLSRGKDYYFRVRAIGANGPSGWSDVATMMVV